MTPLSWLTLLIVASVVWGGFAFALRTAVRSESARAPEPRVDDEESPPS